MPPMKRARHLPTTKLRLSATVRLRPEHSGGIICATETGTTVDVDRGAFMLLHTLRHEGPLSAAQLRERLPRKKRKRGSQTEFAAVISRLIELGIIVPDPLARPTAADLTETPEDVASTEQSGPAWPEQQHISAPVTVHWAITYACNQRCPDCYARRHHRWIDDELQTPDALRLVDRLAHWGVLQLAIGGGEPLLRSDLPAITQRAREHGLVVHVTTGAPAAFLDSLPRLGSSVAACQLGIRADLLLANAEAVTAMVWRCVGAAEQAGVSLGANLILCRCVIEHFERLVGRLSDAGIRRITLLRYKPPEDQERWLRERPTGQMIADFEHRLAAAIQRHRRVTFRIDCALSFLQRKVEAEAALAAGIRGCVAGQRILAAAPDASAYPCSQLVHPDLRTGNLLTDDLDQMWAQNTVIKRYRFLRSRRRFHETLCGICRASDQCAGCRVFADDARGADPGCPGPVLRPLEQLGKTGRKVDLREYVDQHGPISVKEYMQRYGVGQKCAVRELRRAGWLSGDPSATGRKQSDVYGPAWARVDIISEIQDSIGYTSAGFPYATREQIAQWIQHDAEVEESDYPQWLRAQQVGRQAGCSNGRVPQTGDDDDEDYQCSQGLCL